MALGKREPLTLYVPETSRTVTGDIEDTFCMSDRVPRGGGGGKNGAVWAGDEGGPVSLSF